MYRGLAVKNTGFYKNQVQFLGPTDGGSQPSVTLTPGDPTQSFTGIRHTHGADIHAGKLPIYIK